MESLTASYVDTLLNLSGQVSNETIEAWIDHAIDMLNRYGTSLPNMTGTAGTKTVNVESKERGAILDVVRVIYYSFYKGIESRAVAGVSVASPDLMANVAVLDTVKEAARKISGIAVSYG